MLLVLLSQVQEIFSCGLCRYYIYWLRVNRYICPRYYLLNGLFNFLCYGMCFMERLCSVHHHMHVNKHIGAGPADPYCMAIIYMRSCFNGSYFVVSVADKFFI